MAEYSMIEIGLFIGVVAVVLVFARRIRNRNK
ncbi:MAG: hypothetical protein ACJAZ1_001792 [Yoonia sp.]|jgi:hypothetical protein